MSSNRSCKSFQARVSGNPKVLCLKIINCLNNGLGILLLSFWSGLYGRKELVSGTGEFQWGQEAVVGTFGPQSFALSGKDGRHGTVHQVLHL